MIARSIRADGQLGRGWERCRLGQRDRLLDFCRKLAFQCIDIVWCPNAVGDQLLRRALDRTPRDPRFDLFAGTISLVVVPEGTDVLAPAIRDAIEKERTMSSPRQTDDL